MELKDLRINPVNVDNEPFVRSLTAVLEASTFSNSLSGITYIPVTGSNAFAWYFPDKAFATDVSGNVYPRGTFLPASKISTLVVYFSAEKYNFLTESYELNVLPLCAVSEYETAEYQFIYDTFPDIDLSFYINNEPTSKDITLYEKLTTVTIPISTTISYINNLSALSITPNNYTLTTLNSTTAQLTYNLFTGPKNNDVTFFYRLTSSSPYQANLKLQSSNYTFSADCYDARYSFNELSFWTTELSTIDLSVLNSFSNYLTANVLNYVPNSLTVISPKNGLVSYRLYTSNTLLPLITSVHFNTNTSCASSVFVTLSANTPPNSFRPWYSAHRVTRALSAVFVPRWLSAGDFIAYPKQFFLNNFNQPVQLNTTNAVLCSPGLAFYGEGHTEYINLSTVVPVPSTAVTTLYWLFGNKTISLSGALSGTNLNTTAVVPITTVIGEYPRIPIELQATDSLFKIDSPKFYYDDSTGAIKKYPYYQSTIDINGNEDPANYRLKQSIVVKPYDLSPTNFDAGIDSVIYLPFNKTPLQYTASLQSSLSVGLSVADRCYDKYGFIWNWSSLFSSSNRLNNQATTWSSIQSAISAGTLSAADAPGLYPKLWRKEGGLSANYFNINPIFCSAGPVTWTLSTNNWSNTYVDPLTSGLSAIENQGGISYFDYSLRLFNDGELLYTAPYYNNEEITLNAQRTFSSIICAEPFDWQVKILPVSFSKNIVSIAPPEVRLYTPNYYVLPGTYIKFQNVTTRPDLVSAIELTFDDDASIQKVILYPPDINKDIVVKYQFAGAKTIRARAYINYTAINTTILSFKFPNIVQVVDNYDNVQPELYRSPNEDLNIPFTNKSEIQPNETVLANVFNFNVEKIYRNLEYLNTRGNSYLNTPTFYYGWLGNPFPYYSSRSPFYQMPPLSTIVVETIETRQLPRVRKIVINPEQKIVVTRTITNTDVITVTSYRDQIFVDRVTLDTPPVNVKFNPFYTWEDLNCNTNPKLNITWLNSCFIEPTAATTINTFFTPEDSVFTLRSTWNVNTLSTVKIDPTCFGLYEQQWRWKSRTTERAGIPITWKQTKFNDLYPKRWYYEGSSNNGPVACDEGYWNTFVSGLNKYYDPIPMCDTQERCKYTGVASRNNILFLSHKTAFRVLSSDYTATYFEGRRTLDDLNVYGNIKNICINSKNQIIALDGLRSEVYVYVSKYENFDDLKLFNSWGGYGSSLAKNKFNDPNDIHVDQYDNIWVTDSGNYCIKQYSSTGAWLQTITTDFNRTTKPLSMCVDSQNNIHVLTEKNISIYSSTGDFIKTYEYLNLTGSSGVRINTSYNRELIYLCTNTQVLKYFRTGVICGIILNNKQCVTNITGVYHDEFRNLLITTNNRVLKYVDTMIISPLKGPLPEYYWKLEDIFIHPEEYVQNWVYNKALQRLWDNIEYFRSTVYYSNNSNNPCQQYRLPIHQKDKIIIHQNEIVTSTVLNRVLGYLWDNYSTLIDYFDPNCPNRIGRINI